MTEEKRDEQNPGMDPERQFQEAIAAARAMLSPGFGNGESAVFANKTQDPAEQKKSKREEMLERLTSQITAQVTQQIGQQLASMLQPAMFTRVDKSQGSTDQLQSQQPQQSQQAAPVHQPAQELRRTPDSIAWPPVAQNAPVGTPGALPEVRLQEANEVEIRPPELRGLGDRLPQAPYGIGSSTPAVRLDDVPIRAGEGAAVSFVPQERPIGGPQFAASQPTPDVAVSPQSHRQSLPIPQVTMEPKGNPGLDVQGGQVAQREELMREYAEANMQLHEALSMFVEMMVSSITNLTEQIYQASSALDRQEFSE